MRDEYDFSKARRGAVIQPRGKTRISIFIDNAVLEVFRARAEALGTGYQTMMNEALRRAIADEEPPLTESRLRKVLQETLAPARPARRAARTRRSS